MRAVILLIVVVVWSCLSLVRPKWGIIGYCFFALCRPDILAWAGTDRFSLILAIVTLLGSLLHLNRWFSQLRNPWVWLLILFLSISLISCVLALVPEMAFPRWEQFLRTVILAIAIPVLIRTGQDMKHLIVGLGSAIGVLGLKFGLYSFIHPGARYYEGYGGAFSMMGDNNTLALGIAMGMPLCWYAASFFPGRRWLVTAFYGSVFFMLSAVVATFSRGAAVSVAVIALVISLRSRIKVLALAGCVLMAVPALYFESSRYFNRLSTIGDYETENSAHSRLVYIQGAFRLWRDYPLIGVGFGMVNQQLIFGRYTNRPVGKTQVVHNTYMQLLTDTGMAGFVPYCTLLFGMILWLGRAAKRFRRTHPDLVACAYALQTSLIGGSVGTFFLSRVDFDLTYMLMMAGAALWAIDRDTPAAAPEKAAAQPALAGAARVPVRWKRPVLLPR